MTTYTADDFTDEQLRAGRVAAIALSGLGLSATFAKLDELTAAIATALTSTGWAPVQESRPLTPDDITDEMVERAREAWRDSSEIGAELWHVVLRAALTEPPARPEGAEELDCLLDEAHKQGRDVSEEADFLASKGVRVVGSES